MGLFGSYNEGDEFRSESLNDSTLLKTHPKAWLVRPCNWYRDEFKECSSFHGKLHQYFIFGKTLDCSQWKVDYDNCLQIRKNPTDEETLTKIIESEERRIATRLTASEQNDIWTYRTAPPSDWNKPLPPELKREQYFLDMKQRQKEEKARKQTSPT